MEAVFSKEIQAGLDNARVESLKKASRLRVIVDGKIHPILQMWDNGFSMDAEDPVLRGFVDIFDGTLHLFQCLVLTSEEEAGARRYEFKRATAVAEKPALDFEMPENAPVGLIEDARQ